MNVSSIHSSCYPFNQPKIGSLETKLIFPLLGSWSPVVKVCFPSCLREPAVQIQIQIRKLHWPTRETAKHIRFGFTTATHIRFHHACRFCWYPFCLRVLNPEPSGQPSFWGPLTDLSGTNKKALLVTFLKLERGSAQEHRELLRAEPRDQLAQGGDSQHATRHPGAHGCAVLVERRQGW